MYDDYWIAKYLPFEVMLAWKSKIDVFISWIYIGNYGECDSSGQPIGNGMEFMLICDNKTGGIEQRSDGNDGSC